MMLLIRAWAFCIARLQRDFNERLAAFSLSGDQHGSHGDPVEAVRTAWAPTHGDPVEAVSPPAHPAGKLDLMSPRQPP